MAIPRHLHPAEPLVELESTRVGPFLTRVRLRRADGREVVWESRRHRKRLGSGKVDRLTAWMAALFMVGSACFALGSMPLYFDSVSPSVCAWTFFVGSVFFTSASFLQYLQAVNAPDDPFAEQPRRGGLRVLTYEPQRVDWWATVVQLAGTLFFNATTFAGTRDLASVQQEERLVWAPDLFGSVAFLVSSYLAGIEVCHGRLRAGPRTWSWWIAMLNLAGSVAFGASAVAAFVVPTTGEAANIALVNLGTFVGAVCFFLGAAFMIPEGRAKDAPATVTAPAA